MLCSNRRKELVHDLPNCIHALRLVFHAAVIISRLDRWIGVGTARVRRRGGRRRFLLR